MGLQSLFAMVSFNLGKTLWKGVLHNNRLMRKFHLMGCIDHNGVTIFQTLEDKICQVGIFEMKQYWTIKSKTKTRTKIGKTVKYILVTTHSNNNYLSTKLLIGPCPEVLLCVVIIHHS